MASIRRLSVHLAAVIALLLTLIASFSPQSATPAQALAPNAPVVISQVYGAGGNSGALLRNDFVELFNRSSAPVSLNGWSLQYASATGTGNFASNPVVALNATLQPGQYYLVQLSGGTTGSTLPTADATGTINASASAGKFILANVATGLACNGGSTPCSDDQKAQIIDLVGYGTGASGANFFEGSAAAPTLSATLAALRAAAGCTDTNNNGADFSTATPAPRNSSSPLSPCGSSTPTPTYTPDAPTITPTPTYTPDAPTITPTATNTPDAPTITPTATYTPDAPTITPTATNTPAPVVPCIALDLPINEVQGSINISPKVGIEVTVQGVVVGDYEGAPPNLRGFYLQEVAAPDALSATSEGIFIFDGSNTNRVSVGQVVQVTGTVSEFQGQTQISLTTFENCGTTANPEPVEFTLPFPAPVNGVDYLERFEGMLVKLPQTLYVTEYFQLGRFGQVVLSSGDRLRQPTSLVQPGAAAIALQAANNLNRIILDDELQSQNPDPIKFARAGNPLSASNTLRGGDTVSNLVGVLNYTWGGNSASPNAYRVRPLGALGGGVPSFQPANPRPSDAPNVGGDLKVASFNVLNYFLTIDTTASTTSGPCGASQTLDCRGADSSDELLRQRQKLTAALAQINADIFGLIELENTPNVEPLAQIVSDLNSVVGAGTYNYVNTGLIGTDAIRVGIIYKPAKVTPVAGGTLIDTDAVYSRPPLAQLFEDNNGARFTVIVNHLKSKGEDGATGANLDQGDGQGAYNALRTQQATALLDFVNSTIKPLDPDVLIIGDLNAYAKEDPVRTLEEGGFVNLIAKYGGPNAYSYVFDGQTGYLDHALASASLVGQVVDADDYHINADEPSVLDYNTEFKSAGQITSLFAADEFRTSDHDPVLVGLSLTPLPAQLELSKTLADDSVFQNDLLMYTLSYTVDRPTNLVLTDTLPVGTEFVAASDGGSESSDVVTWNLGSVPAGSGSVQLALKAISLGTIVNTARLSDANSSVTASASASVTVRPVPPQITSTPVTTAMVNQPYSYDVDATGVPGPSFSLETAPTGMTIDAETGLISWTPTALGTYDVVVRASNTVAPDATQSFQIVVSLPAQPLQLTSLCSDFPSVSRNWRVRNLNSYPVIYTYEVYGTAINGTLTAQPGDNTFSTPTQPGPNTVIIKVAGVQQSVKASSGAQCSYECYVPKQAIESYTPGKQKNGRALPADRSNPTKALGLPQKNDTLNFVSLGFGGSLVVRFDNVIVNNNGTAPDIRVWETSYGDAKRAWSSYPEAVRVEASQDGVTWVTLGTTTNKDQAYHLGSLGWAKYIRLTDISNPSRFSRTDDGFDVDAIEVLTACVTEPR